MNEKEKEKVSGREIDLRQLLTGLLKKSWIIVLVSVICAALTFLGTYYFVTPQYRASSVFYVNNNTVDIGNVELGLSSGDITARKSLVDSYIVILKTKQTLLDVIDYADVKMGYTTLRGMITAGSVDGTEIFQVVITSPDPYLSEKLANAIAHILPNRISNIIKNTEAVVVDTAVVPSAPSSPSYSKNTTMGFLIGLVLSMGFVVLWELFDVTIRTEEDVASCCNHPVLASVPDMLNQSKGGYYYRDGNARAGTLSGDKKPVLVGPGISFAASEAYKLLRTKLQFSFVDDQDCHIIGVSSALAGEGKSLSSINLAYAMAQLEKKVLLVDCDMRRPSLNAKLPIQKVPGLSNYLTRQVSKQEVIQKYTTEECEFDVVSSGRNPPNPIELLSSDRMIRVLEEFRADYDYIILDLPPVGEVSDALVATRLADGILFVVRQNYCDRNALGAALDQFRFVETRILGVVLNCTTEDGRRYGKRYYRGYRRYYSRYEGSYVSAAKASKKDKDGDK